MGTVTCDRCGAENRAGSSRCFSCLAELSAQSLQRASADYVPMDRWAFWSLVTALAALIAYGAVWLVAQVLPAAGPAMAVVAGTLLLAAPIMAVVALRRIRKHPGTRSGARLAYVALIPAFLLILHASGAAFLLWVQRGKTQMAERSRCAVNMQYLSEAIRQYAGHHGRFPSADRWVKQLEADRGKERIRSLLYCPSGGDSSGAYAFNAALDGVPRDSIRDPAHTVVLLESSRGRNAAGGPELLPDVPRHQGGDNYGFADGHAEWLKRRQNPDGTYAKEPAAEVRWEVETREPEE